MTRLTNPIAGFLIAVMLATAGQSAFAKDDEDNEVNYLDLAALMLRDGNTDRALSVLDQVDLTDEEADPVRYYTLRGLTHQRRDELEPAREAFMAAIRSGEVASVVHIYLAQTNFRLQLWRETLKALDAAGPEVAMIPSVHHMRAQCHWELEEPHLSIAVLDAAAETFPDDDTFARRKLFFLIELGFYVQAAQLGRDYMARQQGALEDYLAIGNALRASGQLDQAAEFLEQALLAYPENVDVFKSLAHVYIQKEQLSPAADLIYAAALRDPDLMSEAAELYRRAGQTARALALNGQILDQKEKLRQRLALLLEIESFEGAASMETAMIRTGLLEEEDLRYALAYAYFKIGEFDRAEHHLTYLNRPDLFRKAASLRSAIAECMLGTWQCL